jgi:hypothetical protein
MKCTASTLGMDAAIEVAFETPLPAPLRIGLASRVNRRVTHDVGQSRVTKSGQRSLSLLRASGSTSRVLNLALAHDRHGETEEYQSRPLFQVPLLNKALLLKHVVRAHERDLFDIPAATTTKVIFLFSRQDLDLGGRSVMVGERLFERAVRSSCGSAPPEKIGADIELLGLLNSLPSFDPFLMRERLRQSGFEPARCYFDLSEADVARMREFVAAEIGQLVSLAFANGGQPSQDLARKLADKLMTDETAKALDPLRHALQLAEADYREGVFSWKGFIYYRWLASSVFPGLKAFKTEVLGARVSGADPESRGQIVELRRRFLQIFDAAVARVEAALLDYGSAFAGLASGQPASFRDFLLRAPRLFIPIGEAMGVIQHVQAFWRFRFPPGRPQMLQVDEALDLYGEFVATFDSLQLLTAPLDKHAAA